ncbi:hypothetical protein N0V82_004370 [Gnomoniopsis sp. IMI 355080]|nr:hypothetical protein N0V82_004370 [Gnomoniopsis sp. IMI 355080]
MWYQKREQGRRVSWLHVTAPSATLVGSLTAFGVSHINSRFAVWRILFLIVGLITVVFGVLLCIFLPDSPVRARHFTDAEKVAALLRIQDNFTGTQGLRFKKSQVYDAFRDRRVWFISLIALLGTIPAGGITTFGSILVTTFGYTPQQALLLAAPRSLIAMVAILGVGWLSDRLNDRSTIALVALLPINIAWGLMIGFMPDGVPLNKAGLLAGYFISILNVVYMLQIQAWNAS